MVNKLKPFAALKTINGIMTGDNKMDSTLPEVIASTINSGGYGRAILSKIPATSTITVNGPKPKKPKIMTINGSKKSGLSHGTACSMAFKPSTTLTANDVWFNA